MVTIWNGIQRCSCGWSGVTKQQQWIRIIGAILIFGGLGLVFGEGLDLWSLNSKPMFAVLVVYGLLWVSGPFVLKKFNSCPSCKQPLKFELFSEKASEL